MTTPARREPAPNESPAHLLVFDGVCGLCHALVRWTARHDRRGVFAFAPLQGLTARAIAARHPVAAVTDSILVVLAPGSRSERVLVRSDAVLAVGRELGGVWRALSALGAVVPRAIRDAVYDFVAARRYRMFGRYESCPLPPAWARDRFLD